LGHVQPGAACERSRNQQRKPLAGDWLLGLGSVGAIVLSLAGRVRARRSGHLGELGYRAILTMGSGGALERGT
jgi:hypothetical protein